MINVWTESDGAAWVQHLVPKGSPPTIKAEAEGNAVC